MGVRQDVANQYGTRRPTVMFIDFRMFFFHFVSSLLTFVPNMDSHTILGWMFVFLVIF